MKKILGFLIGVACCFNLKNVQGASFERGSIERANIACSSLVPQTTGQYPTFGGSFNGNSGQSSLSQPFVNQLPTLDYPVARGFSPPSSGQPPFPGMQSSQNVAYSGFYNGMPCLIYMQVNSDEAGWPPQYSVSSHMLGNDYGTQTNTQQAVQGGSQLISLPPVTITRPPFNADLGFHSRAQLTPGYQHNESPINATYDLPPLPTPLNGVETIPHSKPNTKTTSLANLELEVNDDSQSNSKPKPQKRPCRCGSLIHQRTNHSKCPLNPNPQWKVSVPQKVREDIENGNWNRKVQPLNFFS